MTKQKTKTRKGTVAWHFCATNDAGELVLKDNTVIPRKSEHERLPAIRDVKLCYRGYHASVNLRDALSYAPDGRALCLVEVFGVVAETDKIVGTSRRVLARIDCHPLLVEMAKGYAAYAADVAVFAKRAADDINTAGEMPVMVDPFDAFEAKCKELVRYDAVCGSVRR